MEIQEKRKTVKGYIDDINDQQVEFLYELLNGSFDTQKQMDFVFGAEGVGKVDTAYPASIGKVIRTAIDTEENPLAHPRFMYSYIRKKVFGELVDFNRLLVEKILQVF